MTDPTKIPIDPNTEHLTELGTSADLHLQAQAKTTDAIKEIEPILEGSLLKASQANDTLKKIEENTAKNDSIEFSINGAESVMYKGEKGDKGETGEPGKTPEKGVDYFTPDDVQQVAQEAAAFVPAGKDGVNGRDGMDGINGIDGINGENGKDAIAIDGVAGRDGVDGKDGKDGSPDTGEQIVGKLEALPEEKRLSYDSLKDLPNLEAMRRAAGSSRDYDLKELKDVNIGTPTNGQALTFDSATQKWINSTGGVGAQGDQGAQGATGAQGAQGAQGATGAQGAQGAQGATGSTGAQGNQGTQGNQGFQGTTGATGAQGTQGYQGTQGTQGNQGTQGTQGTQGNQGAQGASGVSSITFIIDGGGATITTGIKGDLEIPFGCTINQVTLLADQSGSIVVDIWKDTYANYPPTVADTITASAKPTISSTTKSQDATLTGWTTTIAAGATLRFNVDSITTCQRVTLSLKVTKT